MVCIKIYNYETVEFVINCICEIRFFISACKGSPVPAWIEQGQALTGFRKNLPRSACGIFPESLAQSGTGQ
jgi:hypothetical protein